MFFFVYVLLTIATHADGNAFLQATVLAAIPVYPQNAALLVLGARPVLDLLLDGASEEALRITEQTKIIIVIKCAQVGFH